MARANVQHSCDERLDGEFLRHNLPLRGFYSRSEQWTK